MCRIQKKVDTKKNKANSLRNTLNLFLNENLRFQAKLISNIMKAKKKSRIECSLFKMRLELN